MTRLLPRQDSQEDLPAHENIVGSRVFRVTDRDVYSRTRLILAHSPEEAVRDDATQISELAREHSHEVIECIELRPTGTSWSGMPEDR